MAITRTVFKNIARYWFSDFLHVTFNSSPVQSVTLWIGFCNSVCVKKNWMIWGVILHEEICWLLCKAVAEKKSSLSSSSSSSSSIIIIIIIIISVYLSSCWSWHTQLKLQWITINQSIKFIISVAHCRLDFTQKNSRKNTSAMLNVNTTKITIVDETRECLSRQMMLTYSVW